MFWGFICKGVGGKTLKNRNKLEIKQREFHKFCNISCLLTQKVNPPPVKDWWHVKPKLKIKSGKIISVNFSFYQPKLKVKHREITPQQSFFY